MQSGPSPYRLHVFVCTNDRGGTRKACADGGGAQDVRSRLKSAVAERGWNSRVRVSQSGCLGVCARGPNVMVYPHGTWFSAVTPSECDALLAWIGAQLEAAP